MNNIDQLAKENGYTSGTIIVLSESYLDGEVYRYGNYLDDEWYEIGKLAGFAQKRRSLMTNEEIALELTRIINDNIKECSENDYLNEKRSC